MLSPAVFGQTITVVNNSGKVVSTSKHLINVFKEAKSAYRERKAEIAAGRHSYLDAKRTRSSGKAYTVGDDQSSLHSRHSTHHHRTSSTKRRSGAEHEHSRTSPRSERHHERDTRLESPRSPRRELGRRNTTRDGNPEDLKRPPPPMRSLSSPGPIDMDLAYGELPPDLPLATVDDENELKGLVGKAKMLLEEADCVQYSVTAMIANLQKNPEAMAAVALTLAEISNIVKKMAPGVLMSLKGSAPAVFALLASPQFLIAAGVGVGVTIVALGGYKIIKRIKAKRAEEDQSTDEMLEYGGDVNRIESWRRGIAEVEEQSIGSVEGEYITPQAAALSRLNLNEEWHREPTNNAEDLRTVKETKPSRSTKSDRKPKTSRSEKERKEGRGKKEKEKKEKKPSPLRLMFQ